MVTPEVMQQMMAQLMTINTQNMATLASQQMDALKAIVQSSNRPQNTLTDTRGIGKPVNFKGDEAKYAEWKAKLMAYLRTSEPRSVEWISWANEKTSAITDDDIDDEYKTDSQVVKDYSVKLYSTLMSCTEEDAFRICHSVKDGSGLEALRLLMKRYEPRTPGTKRALLKAVINNPQAKKPDDIEKNLMHVEELMKKYETMSGEALPEDLRATVIIDLCTKDLKEHLELSTKDMKYREIRDEITGYVERKRDQFGSQLKAMEVDSHEEVWRPECETTWWGGHGGWNQDEQNSWEECAGGDICPFQTYYGKGKGKGKGGKGGEWQGKSGWQEKGKGKGGKGGDWQGGKGSWNEKGKGKGKGGGFQGNCHWCAEWGHSQSRCRAKDEYMEGIRNGKGQEKGGATYNVEATGTKDLETLEAAGTWRTLCYLGQKTKINMKNRYEALSEEEEGDNEEDDCMEPPPGLEKSVWLKKMPIWRKKQTQKDKKDKNAKVAVRPTENAKVAVRPTENAKVAVRPAIQKPIIHDSWRLCTGEEDKEKDKKIQELNAVNMEGWESGSSGNFWITIDSGASENVISEKLAPRFPTKPSAGSREGVQYTTASGEAMPNRGEKDIKVVTQEGNRCMLKMQVTDVQKPLMSVARICDAGHRVIFDRSGGVIEHESSGQRTRFQREDNVYRLKVDFADASPGFTRQGK